MQALHFVIEQIAICPRDPERAKVLLSDMGAVGWVEDHVKAKGKVFGFAGDNEANLSFNYNMFQGSEFEVLEYTAGSNWMAENSRINSVSHLGTHCTDEDLEGWRAFFDERGIKAAQEVETFSHTNQFLIDTKRTYQYVIFDTKEILGVDVKFIVRKEAKG